MHPNSKDAKYTLKIKGNVAIFTHDACTLHFEEGLEEEIFRFEDPPFSCLPQEIKEQEECTMLFWEKAKPAIEDRKIMVLKFNEFYGALFHSMKKAMRKSGTALWLLVSFFDSDETISRLGEGADAALEKKAEMIDRMLHFPYIKRLETPPGGLITRGYIRQLYYGNVVKEKIDGDTIKSPPFPLSSNHFHKPLYYPLS